MTNELDGAELDAAVARCEGRLYSIDDWKWADFAPSSNWAHGGPIIERELIDLEAGVRADGGPTGTYWTAYAFTPEGEIAASCDGPTPLIAAMRCYVAKAASENPPEGAQNK